MENELQHKLQYENRIRTISIGVISNQLINFLFSGKNFWLDRVLSVFKSVFKSVINKKKSFSFVSEKIIIL